MSVYRSKKLVRVHELYEGDGSAAVVRANHEPFVSTCALRTPKEAAALLRCSLQMLAAHVRAGSIRYIQVGLGTKRPRRMFVVADLIEFIDRSARRDTPPHQYERNGRCRAIGVNSNWAGTGIEARQPVKRVSRENDVT